MPRRPRLFLPGCAQHIIQRGNNKQACFYHPADYKAYLHHLKVAAKRYEVKVHAFVLMTNHVHILATPVDKTSISLMMQAIGRAYVRYFNFIYERTGTLWEGRFKSAPVETESYLLTLYRYIELNPVRAGMVEQAEDYPWSSFHANASGKAIELLTPHECYLSLGVTKARREWAYRALFGLGLDRRELEKIRQATNKARALGGEDFQRRFMTLSESRAGFSMRY